MISTLNFFLHVAVFGLTAGTLLGNWVIHRAMGKESSWEKRMQLGGVAMGFAAFGTFNVVTLLVTGILNMANRYGGFTNWPMEHWLMTKIVLFAVIAYNALVVAKKLGMARAMLIRSVAEGKGPQDADVQFAARHASVGRLLTIQTVLLAVIVFLATYGSGKHPGMF